MQDFRTFDSPTIRQVSIQIRQQGGPRRITSTPKSKEIKTVHATKTIMVSLCTEKRIFRYLQNVDQGSMKIGRRGAAEFARVQRGVAHEVSEIFLLPWRRT